MALTNSQYDTIMRTYNLRQAQHRHELEARREEAQLKFPRLKEIDDEIAAESVRCGKQLILGGKSSTEELVRKIDALSKERAALLASAGFPSDYLSMTYDCPDCKDTGYVDGSKCHCFKQAEIDLLYTQSNLKDLLSSESFSSFSLDYYSPDLKEEKSGVSSLDRAKHALAASQQFAAQFDSEFANLFFYGDTGVGKTFLSHCIARELLDSTHSVVYFSAQDLFEALAQKRFGRGQEETFATEAIYQCDLLIIDDLGTELTNSFVNSELFLCINERLNNRRSTIISTNLPLKTFADTYSERIFSRISNSYTMLKLFGKDIRLLKKVERNLAKNS